MIKLLKLYIKRLSISLLIVAVLVYTLIPQSAQATATIVTSATSSNTDGATDSLTVTMPSGVTSGDLLVIVISDTLSAGFDTPSSWTAGDSNVDGNGGNQIAVFYKIADGTEGADEVITYFSSGSSSAAVAMRITGFNSEDIFAGTGAVNDNTTGSITAMTSAAMTTDTNDALVIRAAATRHTDSITNPASHTHVNEAGSGTAFDDSRVQVSTMVQAVAGSTGTADFVAGGVQDREWVTLTFAINDVGPTIEQQAFRFRNDDGNETAATWKAAENTDITETTLTNVRLRLQASTTGDTTSSAYKLQYRKSTWPYWQDATTTDREFVTPAYIGEGTYTSGTGALTVPNPTGLTDGDVLIMCANSANQDITTPTGWTEVTGSPQGTGTADFASAVRAEAFYKVVSGTQTDVTVADAGTYTVAQIHGFRGVSTSTPIDASDGSQETASTTSISWPSVTTVTASTTIALCIGLDDDANDSTNVDTYVNAALTNITERHDQTVNSGVGGGIGFVTANKITAGAVGNTTATGDASNRHSYITIALKPLEQYILISPSANITAGGEDTTAQLSVPSSKSFTTGRMWDNENGFDATDIATDRYTEWEWSLIATTSASNGDIYQFRVTRSGTAFNAGYNETPEWTIGTAAASSENGTGIKAIINNGTRVIINAGGRVIIR